MGARSFCKNFKFQTYGYDDFTAEETLSIKFSIFTKTKLLLNHSFSQSHNSSNLQSSLISLKDFSIMLNLLLTKTFV